MSTDLSRRRFLEPAFGTALLLLIPGCGGGGGTSLADSAATLGTAPTTTPVTAAPSTTSAAPTSGSCGSSFDFNHGHVLVVLKSDLDSATDVTYRFQGSADHTHAVTFTVAQLGALKAGTSVIVTSTTAYSTNEYDHHHVVTVSCI